MMLLDDMDFVKKLQEPSYTDLPSKTHPTKAPLLSSPQNAKHAQDTQLRKAYGCMQ